MQTPFSDFKTSEMSIEKIEEVFTAPANIDQIYSPNAMFITGQRGSGKTMFMRYVENHPKIEKEKIEYIGVYWRFDRMIYASTSFCDCDLFIHHLIITFLSRLVNRLDSIYKQYDKKFQHFAELSDAVCETFFDNTTKCSSFDELAKYLEKHRFATMRYIRNPLRAEYPLICDYSDCLLRITDVLHQEQWLVNLKILFLLDEYENLNIKQRQAVNGLIKSASYGYTFKVFHRPINLDTRVLDSDEHLMEQHDIMSKDFYEEILGGDDYYPIFLANLVEKRLELYYKSNGIMYSKDDLDINRYLTPIDVTNEFSEFTKKPRCIDRIMKSITDILPSRNDEVLSFLGCISTDVFKLRLFQSILQKHLINGKEKDPANLIIAKNIISEFNTNSKLYKGWVENYKFAVLYLLCFENQTKKQTAGWEQILNISNGIARHVINILHYTFEKDSAETPKIFKSFSPEEQTEATYKVASKLYEDIIRVPVFGKAELSLIQYYGTIFQLCHKDTTIKKWEVNHFVISQSGEKAEQEKMQKTDQLLDAAITWGHISKKKVTKAKNKSELAADLSEYHLHPLISVYFGISWRSKQRYATTYQELYDSAYENDCRIRTFKKAASKIVGYKEKSSINLETSYSQTSLFSANYGGND